MTRSNATGLTVLLIASLGLLAWLRTPGADRVPAEPAPAAAATPSEAGETRVGDAPPRRTAPLPPAAAEPSSPSAGPGSPGPGGRQPSTADHSGEVVEFGGHPAAGIVVALQDREGQELGRALSDARGRFTFDQPLPSDGRLLSLGRRGEGPRLLFRMRGRPELPVILRIMPPGEITGTVVGEDGRPVAGVLVSSDRQQIPNLFGSPFVDLDGIGALTCVTERTGPDGRFRIRFAGHGTHQLRGLDRDRNTVATGSAEADEHQVVLQQGAVDPSTHALSGLVVDGVGGEALAGIGLHVNRIRRSGQQVSELGAGQAVTDAEGRYEVAGLAPGTYRLVHQPGRHGAMRSAELEIVERDLRHDVTLWPTRRLRVRVLLPDGRAAGRAWLTAHDRPGDVLRQRVAGMGRLSTGSVRADDAGRVEMVGVPANAVEIRAVVHDLLPAGSVAVDLTDAAAVAEELLIRMPIAPPRGGRQLYLQLREVGGEAITVEPGAAVTAEVWAGGRLVSSVRGRWEGDGFHHGHGHVRDEGMSEPTISVLAPRAACEVRLSAPGYYDAAVVLAADAGSPAVVTFRR